MSAGVMQLGACCVQLLLQQRIARDEAVDFCRRVLQLSRRIQQLCLQRSHALLCLVVVLTD
jgi:hypothetical protein